MKVTIVERQIADLRPAEYNPRFMSENQSEHLSRSIKRFGMVEPLDLRKSLVTNAHINLGTIAESFLQNTVDTRRPLCCIYRHDGH